MEKCGGEIGAFAGSGADTVPIVQCERVQALFAGAIKQKSRKRITLPAVLITQRSAAVWSVVAIVAIHVVACREALLVDGLGYLDLAQWRTAEVSAVAVGAGSPVAIRLAFVRRHPLIACRMHAVRSAGYRARYCRVAYRAFGHRTGMSLQVQAQGVVLGVGARILGMRRAVASLALQVAVTLAEAEQAGTAYRRVGIGGKRRVSPDFRQAAGVNPDQFAHAIVVAGLAIRLVEPAGACSIADLCHRAVAALAGHQIAVSIQRIGHGAAQTLGNRAGVARVT